MPCPSSALHRQHDDGGQTAARTMRDAVRPEALRLAHGAVGADVDGPDARARQPDAVEGLVVHVEFFAAPLDAAFGRLAESGTHRLRHVLVGLKAALTDARADGGANVLGTAAVFPRHGLDGPGSNAERCPAPSGMDGGDGTADRVKEQNGRAVGTKRDQCDARFIGDLRVADLRLFAQKSFTTVFAADAPHDVRVALLCENGVLRAEAHGGAENAVVFIYIFGLVASMRAEVETRKYTFADAAIARGEAVEASRQRVGGQIFKSSVLNGMKQMAPFDAAYCRVIRSAISYPVSVTLENSIYRIAASKGENSACMD